MWTVVGRLLEDLEEGVGGLLHEVGGGEDEDLAWGLAGEVVGALDEGADLAEFDEELRGVGRDDEDVGVGLNEDAGVLLVGLAELFAGGDGFVDLFFEVGGGGDAGAVVADTAEAGEGLAVGPEISAGLALALDGHGEHEGEGVFSCSAGSGEDEGVGEAAGGDGGAKVLDGGGVAEEVVEGGGQSGWCSHDLLASSLASFGTVLLRSWDYRPGGLFWCQSLPSRKVRSGPWLVLSLQRMSLVEVLSSLDTVSMIPV